MDIAEIRKKAKEKREEALQTLGTSNFRHFKPKVSIKKPVPSGLTKEKAEGVKPPLKGDLTRTIDAPPVTDTTSNIPLPSGLKQEVQAQTPISDKGLPLAAAGRIEIPSEEVYRKSLEAREAAEGYKELLTFLIENEGFALNVMEVKEIIKMREVTDVPDTQPFVRGIISLRGDIIPVIDLRVRLDIPPKPHDRDTRIVITASDDQKIGLIVDSVGQVLKIPESKIEPPPPLKEGIDIELLKGVCHVGDRLIVLLELPKVWGRSTE